jgi:NADH dehydrogenase (ubiquinone) 1 alpha subcomplex subunit 8
MSTHRGAAFLDQPYVDPNPLPSSVPHVDELGATSAPLKSTSFFIGQHCKDVNGARACVRLVLICVEDFMLCKAENRDPAHCLKEGRKVTRCAAEVYVIDTHSHCSTSPYLVHTSSAAQSPADSPLSIGKIRESCLAEFDAHWQCLEKNNQVSTIGREMS